MTKLKVVKFLTGGDNSPFTRLMEKIWAYHRLPEEAGLKETWRSDLFEFPVEEIEKAWNVWRKDPRNEGKFIRSVNVLQLLAKKKIVLRETSNPDVLMRGISFTTDLLLDRLEAMRWNMPDLNARIGEAKSPSEKMLLCAMASGEENALKTPFAKFLINKMENAI
jgi:hypothetical protein